MAALQLKSGTVQSVLSAASKLEPLPSKGKATEEEVTLLLKPHVERISAVFVHYCRFNEGTSLESITRFKLVGLQRLVKDAAIDTKDFDLESITRVFARARPAPCPSTQPPNHHART